MRVQRSFAEVVGKLRLRRVVEVGRLVRDVRRPLRELATFLGLAELEAGHVVRLRCGYEIALETIDG